MDAFNGRDIIEIDDESDEQDFEFEDFFTPDEIQEGFDAMNFEIDPGRTPGNITNLIDGYQTCLREILEVFPDISHDHVQQIHDKYMQATDRYEPQNHAVAQNLIEEILDTGNYPKEKDRIRELKRKRSGGNTDEEEAARWKYADMRDNPTQYQKVAIAALKEAFDYVPANFVEDKFKEHHHYYGAFFAILEAQRGLSSARNPPFTLLKKRRSRPAQGSIALMVQLRGEGYDFEALKKEIDSASRRRKREDEKHRAEKDAAQAEEAKDKEHRQKGEVMECGCCFDTITILKVTHCNGEEPHFFCLDCAQSNAKNDIGNSRYELRCMDGSGCRATFSRQQKARFLDTKMIEKLERLQQQDEIRQAELQNLWTCPFCDFAAICPPIDLDREFRCHNPDCEEISCRFCKQKSHIPLTCEEHKKEQGVSERRVIEEARTEALVRTCGKCKVRILKEDGCNKVICTSCYAVLCDYCGKDITKAMYNHFDGQGRAPPGLIINPGGKCPLYDESHKRKDQQVEQAEKDAMAKVRAEHPDISEEDLKIKFAKSVQSPKRHHHHGHIPALNGAVPGDRVLDFQPVRPLEGNIPRLEPAGQARNPYNDDLWQVQMRRQQEQVRAQVQMAQQQVRAHQQHIQRQRELLAMANRQQRAIDQNRDDIAAMAHPFPGRDMGANLQRQTAMRHMGIAANTPLSNGARPQYLPEPGALPVLAINHRRNVQDLPVKPNTIEARALTLNEDRQRIAAQRYEFQDLIDLDPPIAEYRASLQPPPGRRDAVDMINFNPWLGDEQPQPDDPFKGLFVD